MADSSSLVLTRNSQCPITNTSACMTIRRAPEASVGLTLETGIVNLAVEELERSLSFYVGKLGFEVVDRCVHYRKKL